MWFVIFGSIGVVLFFWAQIASMNDRARMIQKIDEELAAEELDEET